MQEIDIAFRVMLAELSQRVHHQSTSEFDVAGRFVPVSVKGKKYWYFDRPRINGGSLRKYIGPDSDETIRIRVERFRHTKDETTARRRLVRTLTREARLPAAEAFTGKIIEALSEGGFIGPGSVLTGIVAYQCYSAYLGVKLQPETPKDVGSMGLAIHEPPDSPLILAALKTVDPTFTAAVPDDSGHHTRLVNRSGCAVDLTQLRASVDRQSDTSLVSPPHVLDYLVDEPVRTVLLFKAGIAVTVPSPERYAVCGLMASSAQAISEAQVHSLLEALLLVRKQADLAAAYEQAWRRGAKWQQCLRDSFEALPPSLREATLRGLREGMSQIGVNPGEVGLSDQ